jgi:hypothetical protein
VEAPQNLDLGYGVEGATFVSQKVHTREWLEAPAEARRGAPDAFGYRRDEAHILCIEIEYAVGLAISNRTENYAFTLVDRHL